MTEALALRSQYRLEEWNRIVCKCRESGLSNREFCRLNGISEKTYYYRLRKLREATVEAEKANSPAGSNPAAGIALCRVEISEKRCCETEHSHIRVHFRDAEIEVARDASPETLKTIFRALKEI